MEYSDYRTLYILYNEFIFILTNKIIQTFIRKNSFLKYTIIYLKIIFIGKTIIKNTTFCHKYCFVEKCYFLLLL